MEEPSSVIRARLIRQRASIVGGYTTTWMQGGERGGGWVGPLRNSNLDPILSQVFLRRQERAIGRRDPWLTVCSVCFAPSLHSSLASNSYHTLPSPRVFLALSLSPFYTSSRSCSRKLSRWLCGIFASVRIDSSGSLLFLRTLLSLVVAMGSSVSRVEKNYVISVQVNKSKFRFIFNLVEFPSYQFSFSFR